MMKMYTIYIQFNNIVLLTYILEFFEFSFSWMIQAFLSSRVVAFELTLD